MLRGWVAALTVVVAAVVTPPALSLPGPEGALTQLAAPAACSAGAGPGQPGDGRGSQCSLALGLAEANAAALSPSGRHLYVGGRAITVFERDARSGALTQVSAPGGCLVDDIEGGFPGGGGEAPCVAVHGLGGSTGIEVSSNGRHVYVVSIDSDALASFDRDPRTGALTPLRGGPPCLAHDPGSGPVDAFCASAVGLLEPSGIALTADGRHLYVAAAGSAGVAAFVRDPQTGALQQLPGQAACLTTETAAGGSEPAPCGRAWALEGANAVAASPDGRNVYVAAARSHAVAAFARDPLSGALTQLAGLAACVSVESISAAAPTTPGCSVGHGLAGIADIVVSADGLNLYAVARSGAISAFDRDPFTGALVQLAGRTGCIADDVDGGPADAPAEAACAPGQGLAGATGLTLDAAAATVYVASAGSRGVAAFERDPATGALRQLPSPAGCVADDVAGDPTGPPADLECGPGRGLPSPAAVVATPDGLHAYVVSNSSTGAVAAFATERPPACRGAAVSVLKNRSVTIPLVCTDPNGEVLTLSVVTPPRNGSLLPIDGQGTSVDYQPFPGFAGADGFAYLASDGSLSAPAASVAIDVQPPEDRDGPKVRVSARVRVSPSGRARLKLRCPASEPAACTGTVKLLSAKRLALAGHDRRRIARRKIVTLGSIRFRVAPARTSRLSFRLTKRARRIVRARGRVAARAIARATDSAGNERKTVRTVTVASAGDRSVGRRRNRRRAHQNG